MSDKKGKNEPNWTKCCLCLERKRLKGHLGHPKEFTIPITRLFAQEGIYNSKTFYQYLVKHSDKNSQGETRLPQINMKHEGFKKPERESPDQFPEDKGRLSPEQRRNAEETESRLIFLEAMVAELTKENKDLKTEVEVESDDQTLKESNNQLDKRLDEASGRLAVYLLNQQALTARFDASDKARQEARLANTEHLFKVQSLVEKLTDRLVELEPLSKLLAYQKKIGSVGVKRKYDPEGLEGYEVEWGSLGKSSGHESGRLLSMLSKRPPK